METKWVRIDSACGYLYKTVIISQDVADLPQWFWHIEVYRDADLIVPRHLLPLTIANKMTVSTEYGFRPVAS